VKFVTRDKKERARSKKVSVEREIELRRKKSTSIASKATGSARWRLEREASTSRFQVVKRVSSFSPEVQESRTSFEYKVMTKCELKRLSLSLSSSNRLLVNVRAVDRQGPSERKREREKERDCRCK
jgi:hypothetical protein